MFNTSTANIKPVRDSMNRTGAGILRLMFLMAMFPVFLQAQNAPSQYPNYPSETPAQFHQKADSFDYVRRVEMIPMRDGVKLHTVILIPRGAKNAPILLTRTPYDADHLTGNANS